MHEEVVLVDMPRVPWSVLAWDATGGGASLGFVHSSVRTFNIGNYIAIERLRCFDSSAQLGPPPHWWKKSAFQSATLRSRNPACCNSLSTWPSPWKREDDGVDCRLVRHDGEQHLAASVLRLAMAKKVNHSCLQISQRLLGRLPELATP
eukprot:1626880-Amphidinium_carterae.2